MPLTAGYSRSCLILTCISSLPCFDNCIPQLLIPDPRRCKETNQEGQVVSVSETGHFKDLKGSGLWCLRSQFAVDTFSAYT